MKKFIFSALTPLLFFLSLFFPLQPSPAFAETTQAAGGYACIVNDNVYFYSTRDEKRGLFLLPQTYFVKVLTVESDFCKIEYLYDDSQVKKVTGYAKTSDLAFVDYTPTRPYLYHLFDVRYTIDGAFSDDSAFLNQITVTCAYYGDYKIGSETYCYVLRGDSFGYIPKPADLSYAPNPEYAERLAAQTPPTTDGDEQAAQESGMPPAQIAILVVLCLLVPVLAALILKPPKRPPYDIEE